MGHIADISLFHADYTLIIAQLPRKLSMAYIDRINLGSAILQHTVCKSAGRSAYVHTDLIF